MNPTGDILIKSGTLIIVAISTGLAIRVYYRNKRMELENSLFKLRLEAIGNIQMQMVKFFQTVDRMKLLMKHPEYLKGKDLNAEASKVDDELYECQSLISKYSVYFTTSSTKKLNLFVENFLGEFKGSEKEQIKGLEDFENAQIKYSEQALDALRNESGLDDIHVSLMKRFKREKKVKVTSS